MLLLNQTCFGQMNYDLKGELTDCSDNLELILGNILLLQNDNIIKSTYIDDIGEFEFKDIEKGTYQIQTDYYYYANKTLEITIPSEDKIKICISEQILDSVMTSTTLRPSYTIYFYGMPKYSDKDLNTVGKEYGVKWQNMGCIVDGNFDKYNEMIEKILIFRNGEEWKNKFWSDVEMKFD